MRIFGYVLMLGLIIVGVLNIFFVHYHCVAGLENKSLDTYVMDIDARNSLASRRS